MMPTTPHKHACAPLAIDPMRAAVLVLTSFLLLGLPVAHGHDDGDIFFLSPQGYDHGGCNSAHHACRTIAYTVGQAGKGGEVRFAEGSYHVEVLEDLFYLSSPGGLRGGYSLDFHHRDPDQYQTLLIGVPPEYREALEDSGFQVIVDDKWRGTGEGADPDLLATMLRAVQSSSGPALCAGGSAEGYACSNVNLLAQFPLGSFSSNPAAANDVWGFTDLNTEREYALVGLRNGMAVIDVTAPAAPFEVGTITGTPTGWRDMKVLQQYDHAAGRWQAFAYVSADSANDRLAVVDLAGLPNRISLVDRVTDARAHNLSMAGVDFSLNIPLPGRTPVLIQGGSNQNNGGFRAFSLANPRLPALISQGQFGYMHDGTTMVLRDPAQIAACPNRTDICEVLADFNESTVDLWDITDPTSPHRLASVGYPNARYVHSGAWSEDGRHLYVHDEFAERDLGINTTVYIFDITSLLQPLLAATWVGPTRAIDHNGYARGNRYYISNYTRGLTILDISSPTAPVQAGFFDSFPVSNSTSFNGAWGVYPFLPSRHVLVSDIQGGLFVLEDDTHLPDAAAIAFATERVAGRRGDSVNIAVARSGALTDEVSIGWEVLHGSAGASVVTAGRGRLTWPAGDASERDIVLDLLADGSPADQLQRFFVRLYDPTGQATLQGSGIASVFVAEHGVTAFIDTLEAPSVARSAGRALVVVRRQGSAAGEVRVDYATAAGTAQAEVDFRPVAGVLVWADGDATARVIEIDILPGAIANDRVFSLELQAPTGATLATSSIPVTVQGTGVTPAPPPPPPPDPDSGSGGGGGSIDAGFLLLLFAGLLLIRRLKLSHHGARQ